jgi:hypothetical protein
MLLALSLLMAVPPADEPLRVEEARTDLVAAFQQLMAAFDHDHDGRVDRAEWREATARTGNFNPKVDRAIPIRMSLRAPSEEVFREMDSNQDGLLSFEEFSAGPLASFDCMDTNHDGIVQPAEDEAGRNRCSPVQPPEAAAP